MKSAAKFAFKLKVEILCWQDAASVTGILEVQLIQCGSGIYTFKHMLTAHCDCLLIFAP